MRTKMKTPLGVEKSAITALVLVTLVVLAPGALGAADDPFEVFPDLRAHAGFSCQDLKFSGEGTVRSLGLASGTAESGQGHLRSNADITLNGTVEVDGDVLAGPDGRVRLLGGPIVTGNVDNADVVLECHPIDFALLEAALDQSNDNHLIPLTVLGEDVLGGADGREFKIVGTDSLTLPAGSYIFSSFEIGGGSTVEVDGEVRILVTGDVKITGGGVFNQGGSPFLVRLWSSGETFRIESQSILGGFVYAPAAESLVTGGAELRGAIYTAELDINGGGVLTRIIDDAQPQLAITSPSDGDALTECEVEVVGTAMDGETDVDLTINGIPVVVEDDGSFSTVTSLWTDPHGLITAIATDGDGNTTTVEIQVTVLPPVVTLELPPPGSLVDQRVIALTGSAGTATEVTVNGVSATVADGVWQIAAFDLGEDGLKTLVMIGANCGGDGTSTAGLDLDTTPPVVAFTDPPNGKVIGDTTVTVTGTVIDAHLESVEVNGISAVISGDTFSVANVPLVEGINTLTATAIDGNGLTSTAQLSITVDTLAPVVTITAPSDGGLTTVEPITVVGGVTEANLESLTINGIVATVTGGQFSAEIGLVEGPNTITATATDVLDRTGSATITVTLDTTAPGVTITEPVNGSVADAVSITVSGSFTEVLSSLTVNGLAATFAGGVFSVENVPLDAEGDNFIIATATDLAGNSADSLPTLVVRDTLPPTITMDTTALPALTESATLIVTGTATDPHLESVTVAGVAATITGDQWTVELTLAEGASELVATAEDSVGHSAQTPPFTVVLDTVPPVIEITSPTPGSLFSVAAVTVEGTVSDPNLDDATVVVNGETATVNGDLFTVELVLAEGEADLVAQATDLVGHVGASSPVAVIVDTLAPVVTLTEPLELLVSTATVEVTGTVTDPHLEQVTVNGVAATIAGDQFTVTGVPLVEGSNLLTATATDTFGHSADSNAVEFILDSTVPEIAITAPPEGELIFDATVTVTGTVADVHLESVEVNGHPAVIAGGVFTTENVPLIEGTNVLTAVARDSLDLIASASVTVVRDSSPPAVAIVEPALGSCVPAGQPITVSGTVFSFNLSDGLDGNPPPMLLEVTTTDGVTASFPPVITADGRSWSVDSIDVGSADGTAIITATANDIAGRTGVAAASLRVDATPPVLTLLLDGGAFPGAAAGETPPPGTQPVLLNRVVAARVSVADGAFGAPEANLTLDGLAYVPGTPIDAEGDHLLVAAAIDCAGHPASVHALFSIDLTAPTLVGTTPIDGEQLTEGPAAYSGSADTELASATINGSPAVVAGADFNLSPISWREGDNAVEIVLTDPAGNQATFQRSFSVSTIEPTVEILDGGLPIPDAAIYTRPVTPEVRATPVDANIDVTLDGAPFILGAALDATGDYTLVATATDGFGRTATDSVSFRVDLEAGPTIAITTPVDGAVLTEASALVNGTVSGSAPTVTVNGLPAVVTGGAWTIADLSLEPDVLNLISAIATDSAGRTASATVSVMVRTGGGQVLILEPVDGASTNRAAIDVVGAVVGGADRTVDGTVTVNGIVTPVALDGSFRTLDVPLASGANLITAEVTDPEGRTDTDVITVHSDQNAPAIVLAADGSALDEGAVFTHPVTITVTITDDIGEPPPPIITLNGNPQPAATATVAVPVTTDGGYLLAVTAFDAAGNERRAERSFTITGGGCGLADLEPADGSSLAQPSATIRGRSGSAESVTIRVPIPDTSPVVYDDYTADLADGTFVAGGVPLPAIGDNALEILCTGAGGATAAETLTIHRLPEGDGPVVEITTPLEAALLADRTIGVEGTVSDSSAAVTVNGRSAAVIDQGDGSGIFTVDLPLTEGPNVLAARALDAVGRAGADRVIVWLDTRAPPVTITSPENNSWHGPRGDGSAVVDVSGLIDIDAEPNLVDVVVSTTAGSVTATVDPDTGDFLATGVPLDVAADPTAIQTVTVTAADSRGHTETAEIGVHFDPTGPAIVLVAPPDLGRYHEGSPPNLTVSGEAWAAEGSSVSINGATIDPTILTWDGPVPDGRFHTTFSLDILRATDEGPVGVIARITQLDGRWAGTRRLLFVDATPPEILEIHPADGSEGVDADSLVLVLFSEPILHSSLSSAGGLSLTRLDTGDPVVGQLAVSGTAVAFVPGASLAPSVDYRFSVGAGVTDLVGHPIAVPQEVVFSTAADAIATAPQLDPALPSVVCASSLSVTGTAAPNTTVRVRDGDLSFTGTADPTGAFTVHLPLTGDGFHVIEVAAVDRSGTAGPATTSVVRVDCSGPQVDLASLDITNSLITLELSEAVDPATATIGFSGAAIRLFDDNDPAAGDQQATVQLSPDGATIELLLDSAPDAWWRDTVIRLVVAPPLADDNGIVMGAPFETLLFPSGGGGLAGGFLFGETYDDTTGRPLQGATASLYLAGSVLPGAVPAGTEDPPLAMAATDSRGRYQILDEVTAGRYTLVLEADDHVRVVRQLSLEPATGTIPFDSRLTPMGDEAGVLDPVAGGTLAHPVLPLLQLVAQPAAVDWSTDLTVHLVPRSGQGLPDALPLGWTPLAAADLVLTTTGDTVLADGDGAPFDLNAVHLDLPLPDWVVATDQLVAVRYHLSGGQWLTVADVEFVTGPDDAPIARVELVGPGSVAVVLPDAGDGAPPLPALGAGNPLRGVGLPDAMPELTATLTLDPPVVPPTGRATASVVALSADGSTPWPSGLAVQAYLEEQLILSGGVERIIEAPYVADLLLYRSRLEPAQLDGNDPESAGAVDFVVSPSERAAEVLLDVGYENIRLYPFPGQLERGQILGPGGGTVTSADGVELSVPEGALPSKTIVQANQLAPDELAALPAIVGYDTIAAVRVELGGHTLARAATLSLDVPAGAPDAIPGDPRLVLAELIEAPADGRGAYPELTARIDRAAGRLTAGPETPDSGLAIDGVRREGLFLVLHAQAPMAYATGLVTAANGFGIELARVTNDGLGTADLSALGGRYAVPIQASPGTIVEAAHPASDESGSVVVAAVAPGEIIAVDIVIVPVAPAVVNVFPDPGVYPVNLQPSITFTEPLNPATVGPGTLTLVLADAAGRPTATRVAGTVALDDGDTQIIFTPSYPLAHGRQWVATFTGGVTDAGGTPYADGPVVWNFSTTTELAPGGQVHPELFHIRLPVDGVAEVYGDVGAVPSDAWSISPFVVREVADPETITVSASATGAFSVLIGEPPNAPVTIDDEVWVRVLAPTGDIETFRLDVFSSPDGLGFVAPIGQAVSFTVVDLDPETPDVTVDVPEGAFDRATMITVTHLDPNTIGVEDDLGLGLGGYIDVDFEGTAAETLVLKVSAPDDIAPNAKVLIGEPVNLAWGRRLRLVGVGGILEEDGADFLSNDESVQPPIPDLTQGNLKLAGDTDIFLGLEEAGSKVWYYEVDPFHGGSFIAFATFLADNQDAVLWGIFAAGQADMWVFQGPPEDWSGQVVLPLVPGTEFTVEHRDAATGWLLSTQSYGNPEDPDGDGVISLDAFLAPDPGPPRLLDASPFHVIHFSATEPDTTRRLRLDLEATVDSSGLVTLTEPEGYEIAGGAGLALYEVSDPTKFDTPERPELRCRKPQPLGTSTKGSNNLLAVVGPGALDSEGFNAFSFTFSRAIVGVVEEIPGGDIAVLTDLGSDEVCGGTEEIQLNIEVETRFNARTLLIRPSSALPAGHHFQLELKTSKLFPEACGGATSDEPCAAPGRLFFTTRGGDADHVGTGESGLDEVRTIAKIGNLLFAGSLDGRVTATDLSGGEDTVVGIHKHHAEMDQVGINQVRAFATDGHGRLFLNARFAGTWSIKAVAVEDVMAAVPVLGSFPIKEGGVRTAFALGSEVGTLSEFMAASALPLATPVDFDVLVRDQIEETRELAEFCAELGSKCELGAPDSLGVHTVTLTGFEDSSNRPPAVPREDSCEEQYDTDRIQRITLDNLSTGQSWTVEVYNDEWIPSAPDPLPTGYGSLIFKARQGDQLRLRYNLQTLGFVALLGSGITVVDLNRLYDTPLVDTNSGLAQCGRRLGKYEGTEIEFSPCDPPGVLRYGIDMTPSVAVLGPTGCTGDECERGSGEIHLYSPLVSAGLVHSRAEIDSEEEYEVVGINPGEIKSGVLTCLKNIGGAYFRDVAIARDVEWVDRGLQSGDPNQHPQPVFTVLDEERFANPERVRGDLLFMSLGDAGIFVFDIGTRHSESSISTRDPQLVGHLKAEGHSAYRIQVEPELGIVLAGGLSGQLDVWSLSDINIAPGVEGLSPPRPLLTLENIPWQTDRLGVDRSGTGLIYAWAPGANLGDPIGATAFPISRPQPILAGIFRAEGDDDPPPRELRPTTQIVPLGIPTELSLFEETNNIEENEARYTAAFKVRISLPGFLGDTIDAKVESLLIKPPDDQLGSADLGPAEAPPGGSGWPDPEQTVTLRRLAGAEATMDGRFGQAYNLYESDEIIVLLADPRAVEDYTPQGEADDPEIDSEAAQCRRCDRPEVLTDDDNVLEMLAGGQYVRVVLDLESNPDVWAFFGADYPVPATIVELAGWADDVPSPVQVSLTEPPLGAAGWSSGEAGVGASLVSGEALNSMVDHATRGRALGFAFERSYRSGFLGYNPLGSAGWTANLFAHLRENKLTGEVAYHDGAGNVWRFFREKAPSHIDNEERTQPTGNQENDFWAVKDRYHTEADPEDSYLTPKGLYLILRKMDGGSRWELAGPNNDTMKFDSRGRLVEIADRLRGTATEDEIRGNRVKFSYDAFSRLEEVVDDYGRKYFFRYHEDADDVATFGLLKEIEDFAGRKVQYRYRNDDGRALEQVEPPNVRGESLVPGATGNRYVSYTYHPTDFGDNAILHGDLAGRRLDEVSLPGANTEPRVKLHYEASAGRLEQIDPADVENNWSIDWGVVSEPTVWTPWMGKTVYTVHHEGDNLGRLEQVGVLAEAVPNDWNPPTTDSNQPAPENATLQITKYEEYDTDGSGRIKRITYPDMGSITSGSVTYDYCSDSRISSFGVETTTRSESGGDQLITTMPCAGRVDNLPSSVIDGKTRTMKITPLFINTENPTTTVNRGFASEDVPQLRDAIYHPTGLVDSIEIGVTEAKSGGPGLETLSFGYLPGLEGSDGGSGYLSSIRRGDGPQIDISNFDDYGNARIIEQSSANGRTRTLREFDEWDQLYEVTLADGGGPGVERKITTKRDLRGRVRETTRTQEDVGLITSNIMYTERGQVDLVTSGGHAGRTPGEGANAGETVSIDYVYDNATGLLRDIVAEEHTTTVIPDSAGRTKTVRLPQASLEGGPIELHRGYDGMGRVVYVTDGHDGWWRGKYNGIGQLKEESFSDGTEVTRGYDLAGGLQSIQVLGADGTSFGQTFEVASFGAVTKMWEPGLSAGDRVTEFNFDAAGRLNELKRGGGDEALRTELSIDFYEDGSGRIHKVTDVFGNSMSYESFGSDGRSPWPETITSYHPGPEETESIVNLDVTYDQLGRARRISSSDGRTITRIFDESSNLLSQTISGEHGRTVKYSWDGWGNLTAMLRPDLGERSATLYGYDLDGNLVNKTVRRSGTGEDITTYEHWGIGLVRHRTLPGVVPVTEDFDYHPDGTLSSWATRQTNEVGDRLTIAFDYDSSNRLTKRFVKDAPAFAAGGLQDGMAGLSEVGDSFTYDGLGRIKTFGRLIDPVSNTPQAGSKVSFEYHPGDPRPFPAKETVERWSSWMPGSGGINRAWDIFDRLDSISGPSAEFGLQDIRHDALNRRIEVTTDHGDRFHGSYTWAATGRLFGLSAGNLEQSYAYLEVAEPPEDPVPGALLSTLTANYGKPEAFGELSTLGSFDYRWIEGQIKAGRDVLDPSSIFTDMGWGWDIDSSHRLIAASAGNAPCNEMGECPDATRNWAWPNMGSADEMNNWTDHLGTLTSVIEHGANGRMVEIEREGPIGPASESIGYDLMGRRITDGLHDFLWSWRGEMVEVEINSGESAGRWITYVYDASGRLLERESWENRPDPHLRSRRGFLWNDWELIAEIGLNTDPADQENRVLWRVEHLPGPVGLDDSPQLAVTTHIHPEDPAPEQSRFFDLVRDEMGTVIAILEDVEPPISGTAIPPLKARILYDPYGQAHVEEGPELRSVEHNPAMTHLDGSDQAVLDAGDPANPVIGIAGGVVVTTSMALDEATLEAGLILERCDPGCVALGPTEVAIARDDADATLVNIMPVAGWLEGRSYQLKLDSSLADAYGRAFVGSDGGSRYTVPIGTIGEVEAVDEPLPSLPVVVPLIFDNVEAASVTLDCDGEPCFPGGLNLLFQGLWTDPVTGISYARNRWYDARTASWLSEDPLGAVDSPNLYAFVGWGPHVATDPLGLADDWANKYMWDSPHARAVARQNAEYLERRRREAIVRFLTDAQELEQHIWNSYPGTEKEARVAAQHFFMTKRGMSMIKASEAVGVFLGPPSEEQDALDKFSEVAGQSSETVQFLANRVADLSLFVVGGMAFEAGVAAGSIDDVMGFADDAVRLYSDDVSRASLEFNVAPHGGQPTPRSPYASHHGVQKEYLKQNVAGYNPRRDPTILFEDSAGGVHKTITGEQNSFRAQIRRDFGAEYGGDYGVWRAEAVAQMQRQNVPTEKIIEWLLEHDGYLFGLGGP